MADESRELRAFAPALVLLAILAFINFIDRSNLSIAAPLLKDELNISTSQLGILLSAFFWTYTAMQFVSGWIVDRFAVNWVLAAGFLLWSLATAATGLVQGFTMLLAMRLVLGTGESVMVPAWSKILSLHVAEQHRGFANGVCQGAVRFGPAVGTLGVGLVIAKYGWRPAFIGIGLISLAWIPAWIKWMPRRRMVHSTLDAAPAFTDILRQRSFWGVCAGHFSILYLLYFMLTLLPFYLVRERHLSMQSMAKIASVYYATEALSAIPKTFRDRTEFGAINIPLRISPTGRNQKPERSFVRRLQERLVGRQGLSQVTSVSFTRVGKGLPDSQPRISRCLCA